MADAHQATAVFEEHKQGIELLYSDEGIHVSFTIPPPWELRQMVVRNLFHIQRAILKRVYPAPPLALVTAVIAISLMVVSSSVDSMWRNSYLSYGIWHIGNFVFPFANKWLPHTIYLGYLAAWASFLGFLVLMYVQRLVLRQLLSYRGWLYLGPGEKGGPVVMIWAGLLKLLSGRNPLTYSFQDALPRLPLPSVKDTVRRYLKTVHPLLSAEEYAEMEKMACDFEQNEAPKLQIYLFLKSLWSSNYVTDWWERYVYMKGRSSLMINSNYYCLPRAKFEALPTRDQSAMAASIVHIMMTFKQALDREQLPPMMLRGLVPLCMHQYSRMFSCTRVPGREEDHLKKYHGAKAKHLAVLCQGRFFKLPLFTKGARGNLLSMYELQRQFQSIKEMAKQMGPPANGFDHEKDLAALTSDGRIAWAENREHFFSEGINKRSLAMIESACFVVVLDDKEQYDWTEAGKDLIHGSGANRWFDKSFTVVVYENAVSGINAEHSWADAPVIAHLWEHVLTQQVLLDPFDAKTGLIKLTSEEEAKSELPPCKMARWQMTEGLDKAIGEALKRAEKAISEFDLKVMRHSAFGKKLMKQMRVSPDGFIQMAFQLAYYRNSKGTFTQTYESSMTRLYREGRTETVRPASDESREFVLAMEDPEVSRETKLKLLQKACEQHQNNYRDAMSGRAVDRHLFTLYCVSVGLGIESKFLQSALGRPWRLSTSQQPQQQTTAWPTMAKMLKAQGKTLDDVYCPGGGFGPVAEDGYGVSYMVVGDNDVYFHVSSKKTCEATSSEKFAQDIVQAMADMKAISEPKATSA